MDNTNQTEGTGKIGRVCMFVELDGKTHIVTLDKNCMGILLQLAASMNMGRLPVVAAPEGFEFAPLSDLIEQGGSDA